LRDAGGAPGLGPDASLSTGPDTAPGWYGKLSALGDFASRRLAPPVVAALDHWLAEAVAGSQRTLGEAWLDTYLASPLQRFVLGPGLVNAGAAWWFGVLMPSCDSVGRYFPLVILQPRLAPPSERIGLDHLEAWWQRAGEAALQTLADDVGVERFERALGELPPWPATPVPPAWADEAVVAGESRLPADCTPGELAGGIATAAWVRRLQGQSLWWSWRPQGVAGHLRIVAGLPSGETFSALLSAGG
jgi:type VI secretion system protein ImpM